MMNDNHGIVCSTQPTFVFFFFLQCGVNVSVSAFCPFEEVVSTLRVSVSPYPLSPPTCSFLFFILLLEFYVI